MRTFFLFVVCFCTLKNLSYSQGASIDEKLIFKINPLQLAMGEIRMQIEKPMNSRKSVAITLSYSYKSEYFWNGEVQTSFYNNYGIFGIGYKAGFGIKQFTRNRTEKTRAYIYPHIFYKYVNFEGWDNFNYGGIGMTVKDIRYHIAALQFNYGKAIYINRVVIDSYAGLGFRYKYGIIETESSRPEMVITSPRKLESWIYPSIHAGCNVGYILKKK